MKKSPTSPSTNQSADAEFVCVVCNKTSSETPFNCRYRVHERNEEILCGFFGNGIGRGQLCDRCYRKWYKHKREKQAANGEIPIKSPKKNTGKRKSKDSPAKKSRKKRQRVVEDVSVSHSDTTLNSAKGNAEFEDFEFPQEKYARRLTRQAAAVTAAILSHSAASSPTASSAKETIFVVHPQENTHPQDETTAQQINLQKYQGTIANHKYPHQDSSGKDSNHLHSDADDEEQMEILPKYEPPRRHRSWSRDSSSFRDVMQNFERSLEDAKEQARKRRRLSLEERETHPSVLHLIQEHYTTVPRKSKRKGAPFRAYPVDSTESSERRTASNEIYLPNAPTLYAE